MLTRALAVHRLTRLVLDDEITASLRDKALDALDERKGNPLADKLSYFLTCPWCVSIWCALSLVALETFSPSVYKPLSRALASSSATGLIFSNLDS